MKRTACLLFLIVVVGVADRSPADTYTQTLNLAEPFAQNPFFVDNAFLREETFGPHVRYWQPSQANSEGVVTFKFDVPFAIDAAEFFGGITAYTVGSDVNYDPGAAAYLDVSTDNLNWTTIASQTNLNACCSGIAGPWGVSSIVTGSDVVYIRSRLFMTTSFAGFGTAQFLRQGAPYGGGYFSAASSTPLLQKTVYLDFDEPIPSGINDVNGSGTGFMNWLPDTGGAIPRDDPHLNLQSMPGYLAFQSQRADINQFNGLGRNLPNLDAPGVVLTDMIDRDFRVTAKFDEVSVPGLSDQLLLYVGTDADNVLRGGFHEAGSPDVGQYILAGNTGAGDFGFPGPSVGLPGSFTAGDDIVLSLSRIDGQWGLEWDNLTNPAASGSFTGASVPWLDSEDTLYVGLMHMDARNTTSQIAKIDYFCVEVEPVAEPSCGILAVLALLGAPTLRRRPRSRWLVP